jgi:hypothetical protein
MSAFDLSPPVATPRQRGHDLYMSFFQDTEGNTMALMSEVRPPAEREPSA